MLLHTYVSNVNTQRSHCGLNYIPLKFVCRSPNPPGPQNVNEFAGGTLKEVTKAIRVGPKLV